MGFFTRCGVAALITLLPVSPVWSAGSVQGIGGFDEGVSGLPPVFLGSPGVTAIHSSAYDITPDGSTVVGSAFMGNIDIDQLYGRTRAFSWTLAGGMAALQPPAGFTKSYANTMLNYTATGVSADGMTIVGYAWLAGVSPINRPFIWTSADGMRFIVPETETAWATAVSADGTKVVGFSDATGYAFLWTEADGAVSLGTLTGYDLSQANDISGNGEVVVGYVDGFSWSSTPAMAIRWSEADGMVGLGTLGGPNSYAIAVSNDGTVIVGDSDNLAGHQEAFRWTQLDGMVGLGTLGGGTSTVRNISHDGLVIVGGSENALGDMEAFRWTQETGMQSVRAWLEEAGVNTTGYNLFMATATNQDGSIIVGWQQYPWEANTGKISESWIARVSPIGSGIISPDAFNPTLDSALHLPRASEYLLNLPMNGAHHRPLMAYDFGTDACGWVTADHAKYTRELDASADTVEFGSCLDYLDNRLRIGIAAGQASLDEDLPLGGTNALDGYYALLETDYRFADGMIGSLLVMQGNWDAVADRAYLNGGGVNVSRGKTAVNELAVRLRVDWLRAFALGAVQFSPRLAYTWTDTQVGDYAEIGGGFPVYFGRQSHHADELRAGLDADWPINRALTLRGMIEGVYRLDDDGKNLQGQVIGLYSVTRPYQDANESWVRAGTELEYRFSDYGRVSVSLNGASRGEDPDISGAVSVRLGF